MTADGDARRMPRRRWAPLALVLGLTGLVARLVQQEVAPRWSVAVSLGLLAVFVVGVIVRGPTWQRWWLATVGAAVVLFSATVLAVAAATT